MLTGNRDIDGCCPINLFPVPSQSLTSVPGWVLLVSIHFDLTYTPLKHLGYTSAMVNISDVCAMNATPAQMLVSTGLSERFTVEQVNELYAGIYLASEKLIFV